MKASRIKVAFVSLIVVAATTYLAVNTRLGVHIVLDVLGSGGADSIDYDPATGPLVLTGTLEPIEEIALPDAIEQPSGIQHRGNRVYIATDQVELFILNGDFASIVQRRDLIGGLLITKQGKLESIACVDNRIFLAGEFGAIWVWKNEGGELSRLEDIVLASSIAEMELSGMTQCGDQLLAVSDETEKLVDVEAGATINLDFGGFLKAGGDLSTMKYSGIACEGRHLYILSESHSSIVIADANDFSVKAVYGIRPGPVADLAVRDGLAYVVVDHNYTEQKPPVYVYDLTLVQPAD